MNCCGVDQKIPQSTFYNTLLPITDDSIDVGSLALRFRDAHFSRDIYLGKIGATSRILGVTVDGADSQLLQLTTADTFNLTGTRSGVLELQGNEAANTGRVTLFSGVLGTARFGTTGAFAAEIYANSLLMWSVSSTGVLTQDVTNGLGITLGRTGANLGQILNGAATLDADVTGITGNRIPFVGVQTSGSVGSHQVLIDNGNDAGGVQTFLFKTRSGGTNANTIVANGDIVNDTRYYGADGAAYIMAARIQVKIDGAPASGIMPGRIEFSTGSTAGAALLRWTLNASGQWIQDTTNGAGIIMGRSGASLGPILQGASTLDADVTGISGTRYGLAIVQAAGSVADHVVLIGNGADTQGPIARYYKTRGTGTDANTAVVSGDILGEDFYNGADGAAYVNAARIRVKVDGAVASGDVPGRIEFMTRISGGALAVRWTIDNAGVLFNNTAANESTGAGAALLGANCPAVTVAAPFTWIKLKTSDGSTVYMPVWK